MKVFEKNGRKNDQVNLHFICIVSHHWNTFFPLLLSQQCAICTISDKKNIVNNHITMEKTLLRNSIHRYLGAPRRERNLPLRTEADLLQPYNRVNAINYSYLQKCCILYWYWRERIMTAEQRSVQSKFKSSSPRKKIKFRRQNLPKDFFLNTVFRVLCVNL